MLTIRQTHNTINTIIITHFRIRLHSVHNGSRVGEAGGFEEDGVKVFSAGGELAEGADEVAADGAADAAIVHGD